MKYFRVSLVTVKSLKYSCSEIETKINTGSVKGSGEDDISKFFEKVIFTILFNQFLLVVIHK